MEPGTKANQSKGWDAKLQGFAVEMGSTAC
jgi:hypothetical protein